LWAEPLLPNTSAQLAELTAFTKALQLSQSKRVNIYTDSKYAFLILHAHTAIWGEQGMLTASGSPIKHSQMILKLLDMVLLPQQMAVIHCPGHQKMDDPIALGNKKVDTAAKEAAQQHYIQGTLLWKQSLLPPERHYYLPSETQRASSQDYCLDHQGWGISPEDKLLLPQSLQWKVPKTLHQTYTLGVENTLSLFKHMFQCKN
jgi:ribonuclease HI